MSDQTDLAAPAKGVHDPIKVFEKEIDRMLFRVFPGREPGAALVVKNNAVLI
jgi:hypothetical protein